MNLLSLPTNSPSVSITGVTSEGKGTRGAIAGPTPETKEPPRQPAGGFQDGFHRGLHEVSGLHAENTRHVFSSQCNGYSRFSMGGKCCVQTKRAPMIDKEILTNPHLCSVFTDSLRRTRLILLVLLLIGIYGLSRTPFLSGKGSFSDAGLFQFLFFPMLANQSTTLHAHCK